MSLKGSRRTDGFWVLVSLRRISGAALLGGVGELEQAYQSQPGPDRNAGGTALSLEFKYPGIRASCESQPRSMRPALIWGRGLCEGVVRRFVLSCLRPSTRIAWGLSRARRRLFHFLHKDPRVLGYVAQSGLRRGQLPQPAPKHRQLQKLLPGAAQQKGPAAAG